jgi:elongation factor 2
MYEESNGDTIAVKEFSGKIKPVRNPSCCAPGETYVKQVSIDMGLREAVDEIPAGNLASTLSNPIKIGETLVDLEHKTGMVPFEGISYVSEPVVTLAVEPKNPQKIPLLLSGLEKLAVEDPNLKFNVDKETGEYLLSGMGELHLEIAVNQLKETSGVEVTVSSPRVAYMETVSRKGVVALAKSPNGVNCFWVQVEPEAEEQPAPLETEEIGSILSIDEHRNVLLDCSEKTSQVSEQILEAIIAGFEYACKAGPLCGESIRHMQVKLIDLQLNDDQSADMEECMETKPLYF